jgi:thiol-disulfide isomerase/thioredoxin
MRLPDGTTFPSIPVNKPLVGLYFAASWCPDCADVTPAVANVAKAMDEIWNVVYIASDSTKTQMESYVPTSFIPLPFENEQERSKIKKHFGVCAAKEIATLGMSPVDRKSGIPTLIVLETSTGKVISTKGVEEIMELKEQALKRWI